MAVAGNYYPLSGAPGAIRISEQATRRVDGGVQQEAALRAIALLTNTAHGGSSLNAGWIEVMLGRRHGQPEA